MMVSMKQFFVSLIKITFVTKYCVGAGNKKKGFLPLWILSLLYKLQLKHYLLVRLLVFPCFLFGPHTSIADQTPNTFQLGLQK